MTREMTKEEAIEWLNTDISRLWNTPMNNLHKEALNKAIKALENQCPSKGVDCEDCPANEPKTKVGKWIPIYGNVKCSVCGSVKDSRNVGKATHYCDFCGAKMEVDNADSN